MASGQKKFDGRGARAGKPLMEAWRDAGSVDETVQNQIIQMAISYRDLGSGLTQITLCRNGVQIGQYTDGPMAQWVAGNAEVVFGKRHTNTAGSLDGPGGIDARIEEARIYDSVLDCQQVGQLSGGSHLAGGGLTRPC